MNKIGIIAVFVITILSVSFTSTLAHHVSTNIEVPAAPMKMSLSEDNIYVAHISENKISVIDTKNDTLVTTIPTSGGLIAVEAASDKGKIYAAVFESDGIDVYDMKSGKYQKTINLPDAELLKVTSGGAGYSQRNVVSFLTGGWDLAYNPNNEQLYVASYNGDVVRVIDTRVDQVSQTLRVADDPYTVRVDPVSNKIVVASLSGNTVTIITPSNNSYSSNISHDVTSTLKTGTAPWCLDIDPINNNAFVTHRGSNYISVVNILEESIISKIQLPGRAQCISIDPTEHTAYASLFTSNNIVKINTNTYDVVDIVETSSPVWDLTVNPNSHKIYASSQMSDEIIVLSPESIRETIPVPTLEVPVIIAGSVNVHGQDVRLIDPVVSTLDSSFVSSIETKDGGSLNLKIPRVLIDSKENNLDTNFKVIIDGKTVNYNEVEKTSDYRVLSFQVPEKARLLEIMGTSVLNEPQKDMLTEKNDVEEKTEEQSLDKKMLVCENKVWLESTKGRIACVTPSTAQKLVERGWGTILE